MKRLLRALALLLPILLATGCTGGSGIDTFRVPSHARPDSLAPATAFMPPTAMAFDSSNRPYLANNRRPEFFGQIQTLGDEGWITLDALPALRGVVPDLQAKGNTVHHAMGEIVFDDGDRLYATLGGLLLFSSDRGASFRAHELPPGKHSLELRTGPGDMPHPPAISVMAPGGYVDGVRWGRSTRLSVLLPTVTPEGLRLGEPIPIADDCAVAGSGGHSGGSSFAVSSGDLLHLVWAAYPDSGETGNPTWIATVDRRSRRVIARRLLGVVEPEAPDVHSRPTITSDGRGLLHVLSGAHGQPFRYWRSSSPGSIEGGWSEVELLDEDQTYASLVCDGDDRLHSVFRQWLPTASLGYQRRGARDATWEDTRTLVHGAPKRSDANYGIFYQRLWRDRAGGLYLAYTYWETVTRAEGVYPDALIASRDGGETWDYADTDLFRKRLAR